jgi:hypothetical protein
MKTWGHENLGVTMGYPNRHFICYQNGHDMSLLWKLPPPQWNQQPRVNRPDAWVHPLPRVQQQLFHLLMCKGCIRASATGWGEAKMRFGSFLKWGFPKSPWVSILKWSTDLDDFGVPLFLGNLHFMGFADWKKGFCDVFTHFKCRANLVTVEDHPRAGADTIGKWERNSWS